MIGTKSKIKNGKKRCLVGTANLKESPLGVKAHTSLKKQSV